MTNHGRLSPRNLRRTLIQIFPVAFLALSVSYVVMQQRTLLKSSHADTQLLDLEIQYGNSSHQTTDKEEQTVSITTGADRATRQTLGNEKPSLEEKEEPNQKDAKSDRPTEKKKPMNILLLYADDWTAKTLGAAGNNVVKTPVLDKLAKEGVRFSENCVTTSICWVSRATLFTGLYMARHNTTMPQYFYANWKFCLYNLLKEHGYHVGHVGKLGIWAPFDHSTVDYFVNDEGWHYQTINDHNWHITEKNEHDSIDFLRTRNKTKPFFLNTAFYATHAVDGGVSKQYHPQNRSMSMYHNATMPTPVTATLKAYNDMPYFFDQSNEGRARWRWRYNTPDKFQHMMKNYYRMASEVDSACGAIMEELRKQGELDNTLIMFTTDNGNFHGEHGLADKWYPHQESIRVPLIIKDPRMPVDKAGMVNEDFTLNVDLAPTILSAAGVQPPREMMGRDMSDLYLKEDANWRTEFFYEHPMHKDRNFIPASEALVRKDYKYFLWPDWQMEQLFNMKKDPYEERDIINETEHRTILNEMRKRFLELKDIVHDTSKIVTV